MTTQDLKQAVSMLYDMELNMCFLEHSIGEIEARINGIAFPIEPDKREGKYKTKQMLIFMAIGGVVGAFIGMVGSDVFDYTACIIGIIFAFLLYENIKRADANKCEDEYQKALDTYNKEQGKRKSEQFALVKEKAELLKRKRESMEKLKQFYDLARIDENYRNLIAIGYMNDFLNLGICTKLEGTDGLYYVVRKELRWDKMETSLSRISSQLDMSIATERTILDNLHSYQRRSEEMIGKVAADIQSGIQSSTAIATYNAERTRKEIEYQNHFLRYGYWK